MSFSKIVVLGAVPVLTSGLQKGMSFLQMENDQENEKPFFADLEEYVDEQEKQQPNARVGAIGQQNQGNLGKIFSSSLIV